jgi:hypothetical protein
MTDVALLEQAVDSALRELFDAKALVPERGNFAPLSASFANPLPWLFVGRVALTIGAAPTADKRYFAVTMTTPSGRSDSQKWLAYGDKDDLFTKLRDPAMGQRVVQAIEEGELGMRQHELK